MKYVQAMEVDRVFHNYKWYCTNYTHFVFIIVNFFLLISTNFWQKLLRFISLTLFKKITFFIANVFFHHFWTRMNSRFLFLFYLANQLIPYKVSLSKELIYSNQQRLIVVIWVFNAYPVSISIMLLSTWKNDKFYFISLNILSTRFSSILPIFVFSTSRISTILYSISTNCF